ncbi:MAG: hypothetical protein Q9182_006994 [Xanthomendoza sp. 2 TL-2023]
MAVDFFKRDSQSTPGAPSNAMVEVACEPQSSCNYEQYGFKGLTAQWMGATIRIAPFLADRIAPALKDSAQAAVRYCSSKANVVLCGSDWAETAISNAYGFGPQLSAFGILMASLATNSTPPVTAKTTTQRTKSGSADSPAQSSTLRLIASPPWTITTVNSFHSLRRSSRIQKLISSTEQRTVTRSQVSISSAAETAKMTIAASNSATADPKPFPFLCLPAEIRNMIYRYVVRFPNGVVRTTKTRSRLQLWHVNRQVYDEASAIFYHVNTFKFFSCYVRKGEDPFGPRLDRIERCYLHLAWTQNTKRGRAFIQWFVKEFATALLPWKRLKYLIVRVANFQLEDIKPLEWLAGIDFVLIDTRFFKCFPAGTAIAYSVERWPSSWCFSTRRQTRLEQRLERLMMSDGKSHRSVLKSLGEAYASDPALSTQLSGPALQIAQRCGGWADDDQQLYDFLGVEHIPKSRAWNPTMMF